MPQGFPRPVGITQNMDVAKRNRKFDMLNNTLGNNLSSSCGIIGPCIVQFQQLPHEKKHMVEYLGIPILSSKDC